VPFGDLHAVEPLIDASLNERVGLNVPLSNYFGGNTIGLCAMVIGLWVGDVMTKLAQCIGRSQCGNGAYA
jgi:hypothetical protein